MEKDEIIIMCEIQEMTKQFMVEYHLIWFDPTHLSQTYKKEMNQLKLKYDLRISEDWKEVKNQIQKEKTTYHLIISGTQDQMIFKEIEAISNISLIFILDNHLNSCLNNVSNPKIKCVETNIKTLISNVEGHLIKWQREESSLKTDFPAFAPIFDDYDKSKMNYLHYYLQGLTKFQNRTQAKQDFLNLAKQIDKNRYDLRHFENTYNDYDMEKILNWYTKPCFVYKMTNNCLRIATSDSIQYCRFLLRDLEAAIKEQFQKDSKSFKGILYRGAFITNQDWERLQKNIGRDIEMHGFLSTTFITIIVPCCSDKEEQGFVDIREFSYFQDEEEILFNVRSRFTILDASLKSFQGKKCRHLVLLYGKQAWKIDVHSNKTVYQIDVDFGASQKCPLCEKDIQLCHSELFTNLTIPIRYICGSCFKSSHQKEYTPLVYLRTLPTQNRMTVSIEGEILISETDSRIPFYGYKCSGCQKKRISAVYYFKCFACPAGYNLWCDRCVRQKRGCQQENHTIIVERSGFSFWSEKLSTEEKDFLNYQLKNIEQNDIFQQGDIFFKGQDYTKAKQYYEKIIEQQQQDDLFSNNQIHKAFHGLGLVYKVLGELNKAVESYDQAILLIQKLSNPYPDAQTAKNYHELGVVYKILGDFKRSKEFYEKGLDIREKIYNSQHQEIAESYDGLAWVYETLGDFKQAILYYQKGLDMFRQVYGENHPLTAKSYNNLATVYSTQANKKKSITYYEKTLEIDRLVLGDFHPDTAYVYSSLGVEYSKGIDLSKSKEFLNKSIEILKAIYGEHNQHIIVPYNNLATVYMDSGKYSDALELYKKTLEIGIDIYGENNPSLALYHKNLGTAFLKLEDFNKATEYLFKCFNILKAVYNTDNHNEVASCYCKLAELYKETHNHELALEYNYKSLDIYQSIFGETHLHVGSCYHNLAISYMSQYNYPKSIEYFLKSIEISKQIFCEYNINLATTYCSLALVYERMGSYQNCLEYNEKALAIYDAFYGPDHVDTGACYNQMGACFRRTGNITKAFEYHERALRIYQASFTDSENHEEIALTYDLLGSAYQKMDEDRKALEYHEKCLSIRKKIDGISPYKLGESYINIGYVNQKLGDSSKAVEYLTQVIQRSGKEDANTCHAYGGLALIRYKEKKFQESSEYYEKGLKLSLEFYGENHEQTAAAYFNWSTAEIKCQNYENAEGLLLKSLKIKQKIFGESHPRLKSNYTYLARVHKFLNNQDKAIHFRQMADNISA